MPRTCGHGWARQRLRRQVEPLPASSRLVARGHGDLHAVRPYVAVSCVLSWPTALARRRLYRGGRMGSISEGTLADILDEAILVAAITCERAGADPPRLHELSRPLRAGA